MTYTVDASNTAAPLGLDPSGPNIAAEIRALKARVNGIAANAAPLVSTAAPTNLPVIPYVASSWPWLGDGTTAPFCSLPNPALGPVRRSQSRTQGRASWWISAFNEVQHFTKTSNFSANTATLVAGEKVVQLHVAPGTGLYALTSSGNIFQAAYYTSSVLLLNTIWVKIPRLGPSSIKNSLPCTIVGMHVGHAIGGPEPDTTAAIDGFTVHAIDINGRVWAWGMNDYGQLGIGSASATPTTVPTLINTTGYVTGTTKAKQISGSGIHTFIVDESGNLWGAGYNLGNQLGNANTTNQASFVSITSAGTVHQIEAIHCLATDVLGQPIDNGAFSFALKTNGTLLAAGPNTYNQYGNVGPSGNGFQAGNIGAGTFSSIYLTGAGGSLSVAALGGTPAAPNGSIKCWGSNNVGQCGTGNTTVNTAPAAPTTTSQYSYSASYYNEATAVNTALDYPVAGIKAVYPVPDGVTYPVNSLIGGGFFTIDTNNRVWYFGGGAKVWYITDTITSNSGSNLKSQLFPGPWNADDGWVGSQNSTIIDMVALGNPGNISNVTDMTYIAQVSDLRLFGLGDDPGTLRYNTSSSAARKAFESLT
jgi:hypothetical protein